LREKESFQKLPQEFEVMAKEELKPTEKKSEKEKAW
jgi:hypothetical protein